MPKSHSRRAHFRFELSEMIFYFIIVRSAKRGSENVIIAASLRFGAMCCAHLDAIESANSARTSLLAALELSAAATDAFPLRQFAR